MPGPTDFAKGAAKAAKSTAGNAAKGAADAAKSQATGAVSGAADAAKGAVPGGIPTSASDVAGKVGSAVPGGIPKPNIPNVPGVGNIPNPVNAVTEKADDVANTAKKQVTDTANAAQAKATDTANAAAATAQQQTTSAVAKKPAGPSKTPATKSAAGPSTKSTDGSSEVKQLLNVDIPCWPKQETADVTPLTFNWREAISQLTDCGGILQLQAKTAPKDIVPKQMLGEPVYVTLAAFTDKKWTPKRYISGLIKRISALPLQETTEKYYKYEVKIVPWLWFLTQRSDCKVWQNKSVPDIVEEIFKNAGFKDYKLQLKGSYKQREYCVQYNETDFNFVSRLLEEEGIFYFITYEKDKHTLVLADDKSAYADSEQGKLGKTEITSWRHDYQFIPGRYGCTSHDFENPTTNITSNSKSTLKLKNGQHKLYDPTTVYTGKDGDDISKLHMQVYEASYDMVLGSSPNITFAVGNKIKLDTETFPDEPCTGYVITKLEIKVEKNDKPQPTVYSNFFACIPANVDYHPPVITSKPIIVGTQEAVITGPKGEEIYTDEYGRVKLQFYWDPHGDKNENSSCWVRVDANVQLTFGIPRIGWNVLVKFINGNPDHPVVTGVLYDGVNKPPHDWKNKKYLRGVVLPGENGKYHGHVINDDPNNPEFNATFPGKHEVNIAKDSSTTIKEGNLETTVNQGDCTVKGNNITHNAQQKFDAQGNQVAVKAGTTADFEGGTDTTVKGTTVKVN